MFTVTPSEQLVGKHAMDLRRRADELASGLGPVVSEVTREVEGYLRRSLTTDSGIVQPNSGSALAMRDLDRQYNIALRASAYHTMIGAFIGNFSDQIDAFREMYSAMADGQLPEMRLSSEDAEVLGTRAALSLAALESSSLEVVASLRQASVLVLSQVPLDQLIEHVSAVIGRTANVERLGRDLEMTFFRAVSGLVYRDLEESGRQPLYSYAGLEGPNNRPFCKKMLSSEPISRAQIEALDNGKVPGVFDNAGGPGCSHFWWISA